MKLGFVVVASLTVATSVSAQTYSTYGTTHTAVMGAHIRPTETTPTAMMDQRTQGTETTFMGRNDS